MTKQPEVPNEDELDVAVGGGFPHEIGHNIKRTGNGATSDTPSHRFNTGVGTHINGGIAPDSGS